MQASDAGHAIKRLQELASLAPGANPAALTEAQAILSSLGRGNPTEYQSEKLAATATRFDAWFDHRDADKPRDPQADRSDLMSDIDKLRKALARGAMGQD